MKVTFTLHNLTENFYEGLAAMDNRAKFERLSKLSFGDLKHCIKQKIAIGQFRDRVELNSIMKSAAPKFEYKIEPRKGYKLVTFEIVK